MDNLSQDVPRVKAAKFAENGAGTYTFDVFVPAGAYIADLIVHNEVLWTAATSASLEVGDYASSNSNGSPAIGAAIDADGFFTAVDLKATDLLAGESIALNGISVQGGVGGAYATVGTNTHVTERVSLVDRFVRFSIVSVGAGTAGRTYVAAVIIPAPTFAEVTQ